MGATTYFGRPMLSHSACPSSLPGTPAGCSASSAVVGTVSYTSSEGSCAFPAAALAVAIVIGRSKVAVKESWENGASERGRANERVSRAKRDASVGSAPFCEPVAASRGAASEMSMRER